MDEIQFANFEPGCLSNLCALQSGFYARVWQLGPKYESVVASGVGEFLQRYDSDKDFVRIVKLDNVVKGGIAIDSRDGEQAQLRWFFLSDELRGLGAGKKLIIEAMEFVCAQSFKSVFLTTISGLDAARRLYEMVGFTLAAEKLGSTWGREVLEQRFEWHR